MTPAPETSHVALPFRFSELGPGYPKFREVGLTAVLVTFSDTLTDAANQMALVFRNLIEAEKIVGVTETSTSLASAFVCYDPLQLSPDTLRTRLRALLERLWQTPAKGLPSRQWRIPTAFGGAAGPQLEEAAELAGLAPEAAIQEIAATPLRVMTIGFAPGQPYLGILPGHWDLPRQSGLTAQVPACSVAVAIRQIVLFANASPTGWRLIGQTAFRVFRPEQANPFPLRPGDMLHLDPVTAEELSDINASYADGSGGATCTVLE